MAYFNICNHCGDHLDPGERCDCVLEREKKQMEADKKVKEDASGQYGFIFLKPEEAV